MIICASCPRLRSLGIHALTRRSLADKNLGPEAQNSFSQTWGVSYALDNCTEWQDVAIEACKVAVILVILDLLRFTKDRPWFEVRKPAASSVLSGPDASCRALGTRRLRFHAGRSVQRRRPRVVEPNAYARQAAGAAGRLMSCNQLLILCTAPRHRPFPRA